jgi:hypothetical protein
MTAFTFAGEGLAPFLSIKTDNINIKENIEKQGFEIVGEYNVARNKDMTVIAFTREDLKKVASTYEDRGALASILKVGIMKNKDGSVEVSLLNPNYMFNAYFGKGYDKNTEILNKIDKDAKAILPGTPENFGGNLKISKLRKYHYMVGMPYFKDPVKLNKYDSFEDGLTTIEKNLKDNNNVKLVYQIVDKENKTAVFGLGLVNPDKGEKKFLPIIGESHFAAMPYEIILQDNKVTMLHGRYRIALYWPELTMGTFSKIMSTPGNIEEAMKSVVK